MWSSFRKDLRMVRSGLRIARSGLRVALARSASPGCGWQLVLIGLRITVLGMSGGQTKMRAADRNQGNQPLSPDEQAVVRRSESK
jgi:hypothetical protein